MMFKVAKLGIAIAAVLALIVPAAYAGVPDVAQSYFVPQSGTVGTPTEGTAATALFKACPNNDGGTSLPNNVRVKVEVRDVNSNPIGGISNADICLLFNGGTGTGVGQQGYDIDRLNRRVQELSRTVAELDKTRKPGVRKAATRKAKKTATKKAAPVMAKAA